MITDSVWQSVFKHPWKWQRRTEPITGILWHCTRGGQWYDGAKELSAYRNWCISPNNRVPFAGGDYAGIASVGIGPGQILECVPDDMVPRYSSWPSDASKLSVEVAQSNHGQPIEAATIAACVQYARAKAEQYGFPLERVFPTNDSKWVGMAGHEDTVQGKASGKSDPGPEFWEPFMAALEADMADDDLTIAIFSGGEEANLSREQRLINARYRRDEIVAGRAQSVNDRSTSAITLSKRAIAAAAALAVAAGAAGAQVTDILGGL